MIGITKDEKKYFSMFEQTASKAKQCAVLLGELLQDLSDMDHKVAAIEAIEHECDDHLHNIFACLHKSFITPIDREDIHLISKNWIISLTRSKQLRINCKCILLPPPEKKRMKWFSF